nr:RIP=27 kda ribosome-inactivating protein {N-terminal} [Bryonia dioica, roots, Peptide Partial, 21 aa] [Bryonia dioica]
VDINFSLIGATGATYKTFIRN